VISSSAISEDISNAPLHCYLIKLDLNFAQPTFMKWNLMIVLGSQIMTSMMQNLRVYRGFSMRASSMRRWLESGPYISKLFF